MILWRIDFSGKTQERVLFVRAANIDAALAVFQAEVSDQTRNGPQGDRTVTLAVTQLGVLVEDEP